MAEVTNNKYHPEFAKRARVYARMQMTQRMMAVKFRVDETTIVRWKDKHPEFRDAIEQGKLELYEKAMNVLALGMEGRTTRITKNDKGEMVEVPVEASDMRTADRIAIARDVARNLNREVWMEKVALEHTGKDGGAIEVRSLSEVVIVCEYDEDGNLIESDGEPERVSLPPPAPRRKRVT